MTETFSFDITFIECSCDTSAIVGAKPIPDELQSLITSPVDFTLTYRVFSAAEVIDLQALGFEKSRKDCGPITFSVDTKDSPALSYIEFAKTLSIYTTDPYLDSTSQQATIVAYLQDHQNVESSPVKITVLIVCELASLTLKTSLVG